MKLLFPLAAAAFVLSTIAVHPQPYDRGPLPSDGFARDEPPPPLDDAVPPPEEDGPPPRRMICIIDTPFPDHQQRCATHAGYPSSPCRCDGSFFEGVRDFVE